MVREEKSKIPIVVTYSGGGADEHPKKFLYMGEYKTVKTWTPLGVILEGDMLKRKFLVETEQGEKFIIEHYEKEDLWLIEKM